MHWTAANRSVLIALDQNDTTAMSKKRRYAAKISFYSLQGHMIHA